MLDSNKWIFLKTNIYIYIFFFFLYFSAIFGLVKPSKIASKKGDAADASTFFKTFICNEWGHNKPSLLSEKNYTPSWEVKAIGLLVLERQSNFFGCFDSIGS